MVMGQQALILLLLAASVFLLLNNITLARAHDGGADEAGDDNDHDHDETISSINKKKIQSILDEILEWQRERAMQQQQQQQQQLHSRHRRPFVTVAFAQSLDGKLAVYDNDNDRSSTSATTSSNYPLSGDESLLLTHALRSIHDGILVGSKTLSIDNPRLSNRLWNTQSHQQQQQQPRPILLDTNLEHITKLLLLLAGTPSALRCLPNRPIVCCSHEAAAAVLNNNNNNNNSILLSSLVSNGTIQLLPCDSYDDDDDDDNNNENGGQQLCLRDVLRRLKEQHGIQTLMVEGGATLLSSLFAGQQHINNNNNNNTIIINNNNNNLVDALCITIAPKIIQWGIAPTFGGMTAGTTAAKAAAPSISSPVIDLNHMSPRFVSLGQDTAFLSRWPSK